MSRVGARTFGLRRRGHWRGGRTFGLGRRGHWGGARTFGLRRRGTRGRQDSGPLGCRDAEESKRCLVAGALELLLG